MMPSFRYSEAPVKGLAGHFDSLSANYGCLPPGVQHYVFLWLSSSDFRRFERMNISYEDREFGGAAGKINK